MWPGVIFPASMLGVSQPATIPAPRIHCPQRHWHTYIHTLPPNIYTITLTIFLFLKFKLYFLFIYNYINILSPLLLSPLLSPTPSMYPLPSLKFMASLALIVVILCVFVYSYIFINITTTSQSAQCYLYVCNLRTVHLVLNWRRQFFLLSAFPSCL